MSFLRSIYRFLCKAETVLCCIGFMALIALVFLSAILRFFHLSMSWNIDMAMLLLAWTAFLGADIAYRSGQLMGVDLLTRLFSKKMRLLVEILLFVIIFFAMIAIVYFGIRLALLEKVRKYQSIPIPYHIVTFSIILASASMTISTIIKIKERVIRLLRKEA
jgi:TRAP-type C4-dicarboxylate transport system permease small subunit